MNYKKSNLPEVVKDTYGHLSPIDQSKLLLLLTKCEELFNGTLGDSNTDPVKFNLQLGAKPCHGKSYPVPQSHKAVFKIEVERLCQIGVLKRQPE